MPDTAALVSMHLLWSAFLLPLAVLIAGRLAIGKQRVIWWSLFLAGCLGMLTYLGIDLVNFMDDARSIQDNLKRAFYTTLTNTDFPFIQISLASLAALLTIRWRRNTKRRPAT